jgi:beta-galactosidase
MKNRSKILLPLLFLFLSAPGVLFGQREKLVMDFDWKFHLGSAASAKDDFGYGIEAIFAKAGSATGAIKSNFNDEEWRTVNLPHDWAVEQEFVNLKDDDLMSHGYKAVGRQFPATTIGWYRKSFVLPMEDKGNRFTIKFDGVFRDCQIWLNEHFIGRNLSGYNEFSFDISDYVQYGRKNTLVLRVDASQYEGWFYEGAGIYRHVWLIKNAPLHIPEYGVFVKTEVKGTSALIDVDTKVINQSDLKGSFVIETSVLDKNGKVIVSVKTNTLDLSGYEEKTFNQQLNLDNPQLWSIENPNLYKLVSTIYSDNKIADKRRTEFGIRTISFDKDKGFFLNGKRVEIKGVCNHQDHAGVGSALPDRIQYYRIERLKEMGVNAYRTSHNPPTNELLEACDRLGMLVLDENRLMGSTPEFTDQFEKLILRDRNHPSVIVWSIGNEEFAIHNTPVGKNIAEALLRIQKRLDPTRLATYAGNNGNSFEGINEVIPIRGFNYMRIANIDKYRKDHPDQILWGTEEASTLCTRGIYTNDAEKGYVSDNDINRPGWGEIAEKWWKFYDAREWLAGAFVWTGFDYRGEPTPYEWPCINSHFGIMDMCGYPKTNFYYYQAWWSGKDVLKIASHWNWKGKEGSKIDVWVESNCESVELFLNGKSLGSKNMEKNSHLEWDVAYEPGTLEAKGIKNGKTLTDKIETTGEAVKIVLTPDRSTINADGQDVSLVTVTAIDAKGREIPTATNLIQFETEGKGIIIGVGNGDPSSHEADKYLTGNYKRSLFSGKCQVIVQSTKESGTIILKAASDGVETGTVTINTSTVAIPPVTNTINANLYQHLGYKKQVKYLSTYNDKYSAGGNTGLTNGIFGTKDFMDGQWQGFEQVNPAYIIDLGKVTEIKKVETGFLQDINSWIFLPTDVSYSFSDDGETFTTLVKVVNDVPLDKTGEIVKRFGYTTNGTVRARYIKVNAANIGICPLWHKGKGGKAYVFVDETVVE